MKQTDDLFVYTLSSLTPFSSSSQGNGHRRRTFTSPIPDTPFLVVQALPLYQWLSHSCIPLSYLSILQMVHLSYLDPFEDLIKIFSFMPQYWIPFKMVHMNW